jgi:hypothetical protein
MTDRAAWSEFICAPNRAGRHLASIGRGASGAFASEAVDLATLQDFLDRIEDERAVELLAQFVDITLGGYLEFASASLHRLLDAMSSDRLGEMAVVGPALRGNVQWGRTLVARRGRSLSVGRYISKVSHRSFDLPINRVLAWLVDDLINAITALKRAVHSPHLVPSIERLDVLLQEAARHHWLSEVEPSPDIDADLAMARIDMGRQSYAEVLRLARRRKRLQDRRQDERWQQIVNLLAVGWLEPLNDDDLFELFALVLTLDVLEVDLGLGAPVAVDLVRPGRREVARFEADGRIIRVFFDQSFGAVTGTVGRYPALTASAPLISSHPRRPDIVVTSTGLSEAAALLIEVKNTVDADYISASIYRCYGYIHDFAGANLFSKTGPACVLMVNGAIGEQQMVSDELSVITGGMRAELAQAMRSALLF